MPPVEKEKTMRSLKERTGKYNSNQRCLKLCGMIERPGSAKNRDKSIYLGDELVGVVVHGARCWRVWRLVSGGDGCHGGDSRVRMYMDRLEQVGDFDTWRETRCFVKGPFSDSLLKESSAIRDEHAGKRVRDS